MFLLPRKATDASLIRSSSCLATLRRRMGVRQKVTKENYLVPQFPYQKRLTLLGLVFFSRKTNHKKRLKVNHWQKRRNLGINMSNAKIKKRKDEKYSHKYCWKHVRNFRSSVFGAFYGRRAFRPLVVSLPLDYLCNHPSPSLGFWSKA